MQLGLDVQPKDGAKLEVLAEKVVAIPPKLKWVVKTTWDMAAAHIADEGILLYSTPAMVGHMERASVEAVWQYLDDFSHNVHLSGSG